MNPEGVTCKLFQHFIYERTGFLSAEPERDPKQNSGLFQACGIAQNVSSSYFISIILRVAVKLSASKR